MAQSHAGMPMDAIFYRGKPRKGGKSLPRGNAPSSIIDTIDSAFWGDHPNVPETRQRHGK